MITTYQHKKLTWVDVENPSREDVGELIRTYGINPVHAEELLRPTERAKADIDDREIYLVLHYPDHPSRHTRIEEIEIDFVITKDLLVTVHYKPIDVLIEFGRDFQVESVLDKQNLGATGGHLFFHINNLIYQGLIGELETVRQEIKRIESAVFEGHELRMVSEISAINRRLLDFKQATRYHETVLRSFGASAQKIFGKAFELDEESVRHEFVRVQGILEGERELLTELRRTNDSLLTAKNNDVTKRLTLMAFVTFPLALVTAVLGLADSPAVFHGPHGFWVIIGILFGLFVLMNAYFTYKKWI